MAAEQTRQLNQHYREVVMQKVPEVAFETIHQCLMLHGQAGYSKDYGHQQRLRDVLSWEIGDGTSQIAKLVIASARSGNRRGSAV